MSLPVGLGEGWPELLNLKREQYLSQCGERIITSKLTSRDDFVRKVIEVADEKNEPDTQREVVRLQKEYRHVQKFAAAAGRRDGQVTQEQLLSLVWDASFALIMLGFSISLELKLLVDCITRLDHLIPDIHPCIDALADFQALQKPLQAIYSRYIDCHIEMIRLIVTDGELPQEHIEKLFEETKNRFNANKEEYAKLLEITEQAVRIAQGQEVAAPQFTKLEALGRGSFGAVHKVKEISTGQAYAWKRIAVGPGQSQASTEDDVKKEIAILRKLSHHHIATLAFSTRDKQAFNLYILPVAECSLESVLGLGREVGKYRDTQIYKWFGCLPSALAYAHRRDIKHKDIKPANILIDSKGDRVLLTDFGLAFDFSDRGSSRTTGSRIVGSPRYLAPECRDNKERTKAVDVFALGCVFAEIIAFLIGLSPEDFDSKRRDWGGEAFRDSVSGVTDWLTTIKSEDSRHRNNLMKISKLTKKMLIEDLDRRYTAASVSNQLDHDDVCCACCLQLD